MAELSIRASDSEREAVVDDLRRHALAGRLSTDELEQRVQAALGARTHAELAALTTDLPRTAPPPAARPVEVRGWGAREFRQQHVLRGRREEVFVEALHTIVPAMQTAGFDVVSRSDPSVILLEAEERPDWVLVPCIFLFPIGLLALLVKHRHRIVVTFDDCGEETLVSVRGEGRRPVRRAFAQLSSG